MRASKKEDEYVLCVSLRFPHRSAKIIVISVVMGASLLTAVVAHAQRPKGQEDPSPIFGEYKGVRTGMTAEDARKKLGTPKEKADDQDFYIFNDNEAVQIFYDKVKTVTAISIDFMTGASDIPLPSVVVGGDANPKPDG